MDGFTPSTIQDQPIPLLSGGFSESSGSTSSSTAKSPALAPDAIRNTLIPDPQIAREVIGTSLNSKTKAILGEFTFEQLGAIKIGKYINGVSGEIDISPNGISATNVNGDVTFALDGTTGDATFKGTVTAGSIVTGGEIRNAAGDIIIDADGLVSQNSFRSGSVLDTATINTSSVTYVDGGTGLTFVLTGTTKVLISYSVLLSNLQAGVSADTTVVNISVDGVDDQGPLVAGQGTDYATGVGFMSGAASTILTLAAGSHTIKIRYRIELFTGSPDAYISQRSLLYLILGT
jgi:hypothetical protein